MDRMDFQAESERIKSLATDQLREMVLSTSLDLRRLDIESWERREQREKSNEPMRRSQADLARERRFTDLKFQWEQASYELLERV